GVLLRASRWHVLLRRGGSTPSIALESVLVSVFFTGVLPFRAGEPMRVLYVARRTGASLLSVSSALVLERVLDLAVLASLAVGFAFGSLPGSRIEPTGIALAAALAMLAACLLALALLPAPERRLRASRRAPRWAEAVAGIRGGLKSLQSKGDAASAVVLSALLWALAPVSSQLVFAAAGVATSYRDNVLVLLAIAFAVALPSSPGFIGTFHGGFMLAAIALGIDVSAAAAAAIVSHALSQGPFMVAGAAVIALRGRALVAGTLEDPPVPDASAT
ncbi:MAG: lysylphosphatidylglycerol synthase transmembrane domain-containing protein, partial [Thermoanaerobaculia bacterium]